MKFFSRFLLEVFNFFNFLLLLSHSKFNLIEVKAKLSCRHTTSPKPGQRRTGFIGQSNMVRNQ